VNKKPASIPKKKNTRRTHREPGDGLFVSSWSALEEYLKAQPQSIQSIHFAAREEKRLQTLLARYQLELPCQIDQEAAEGLRAAVKVGLGDEDQFLQAAADKAHDLVVACDHITDTRNLGAIARTAAFFGVQHLLLPKDRQAPITSATLGAAQGAFARVEPVLVTNLARTLMQLKERGYWIIAADMHGTPLSEMRQSFDKTVLVLGSEDRGVGQNILAKSDVRLAIPSPEGQLESLNVSVAAGILIHGLYELSGVAQNRSRG
jgi:predicted rRNA methylase